ncbi:hypothetical protein MY11210_006694 [Beauveria gryllotalpidicola]
MGLIDLPPELLVAIASFLDSTGSISKFARTNRRMFQTLENYLYRYDVAASKSSPKALRITSCFPRSDRHVVNSIIQKSLAAGADVNASLEVTTREDEEIMGDTFHTTAISMAALTGNVALVRILVGAGANVNSTCWMGVSVLGYAMRADNIEIVQLLLAQPGMDPNYWCRQQDTALLTAVARDTLDFAQVLLPLADPNQMGKEGITPLRLAVREQNDSMVSLLLSDSRTNPNDSMVGDIKTHPHDSSPSSTQPSIFALACSLSSTKIVELLHDDCRTDVESSGSIEQTPARMAFVQARFSNIDLLIRSDKCKTARHIIFCLACSNGNLGLAEKTLELATYHNEQFLERWEKAARTAGWEQLATRVAMRWDTLRTMPQ